MERTTGSVTGMFRSWRQPIRQAVLSAFMLPLTLLSSLGQERITVLIPKRVDSLIIDNRYQQPVSPAERQHLIPFEPMTVINESALLGDGYTPCMQVEIEGAMFYLPVDRHRRPLSADVLQRYSGVRSYQDTVGILASHTVSFVSAGGRRGILSNEHLRRYFVHAGLTYVRRLSHGEFGWVTLRQPDEGRTWAVIRSRNRGPVVSDWLLTRVKTRIATVNKTLRTLYDWFNKDTGQSWAAPEWTMALTDGGIVCSLQRDTTAVLSASTMMLGKEFESYILGTGLQMLVEPGRIEIRKEE